MSKIKDGREVYNKNNYGQVNAFVNELRIDDWIILKGSGFIRFGRVVSDAILEVHSKRVDFSLVRDVVWGAEIKHEDLPIELILSLSSPMTFYNVDKHKELIHHTLYPFFKIGDYLYLSINIRQTGSLQNIYLSELFKYLNEIEFISKMDNLDSIDLSKLDEYYYHYARDGILNLTTKASFNSPGEVFAKVFYGSKSIRRMYILILLYSMLFGHDYLGFDGVIDLDSRQKIIEAIIQRVNQDAIKDALDKLKLKQPKYDNFLLEAKTEKNISI